MIDLRAIDAQRLPALERLLHAEIPLSQAMAVRVLRLDRDGLTLAAALQPNLNHKRTAFGGSLNSLATLACWGLIQLLRPAERPPALTVVIQESQVQFLKPVNRDFEATCSWPAPAQLEKFLRMLERRGRARLQLEATISVNDTIALRFRGQFVAYEQARYPGFESTLDAQHEDQKN